MGPESENDPILQKWGVGEESGKMRVGTPLSSASGRVGTKGQTARACPWKIADISALRPLPVCHRQPTLPWNLNRPAQCRHRALLGVACHHPHGVRAGRYQDSCLEVEPGLLEVG